MPTKRETIRVDGRGRILLPKEVRRQLGIEPGTLVQAEVDPDGSVVLRDIRAVRRQILRKVQGSFAGRGGSVDDLIAERRREAAKEEAEMKAHERDFRP